LTFYLPSIMTADLAAALLNRAANGAELLSILDSITDSVEQENIADAAAHYAAISAPTLSEVQF
jgi:hypothetical protein